MERAVREGKLVSTTQHRPYLCLLGSGSTNYFLEPDLDHWSDSPVIMKENVSQL